MTHLDHQAFAKDVLEIAHQIELMDALGTAREAQSFPAGTAGPGGVPPEEVVHAKVHATKLVGQPRVIERLCPALKSASDDMTEIAKVVATAMLPLALGPQAVIPLTPLAFGALAFVIFRTGIRSICPEKVVDHDT